MGGNGFIVVAWVNVTGLEFPHVLYAQTYRVYDVLQLSVVSVTVVAIPKLKADAKLLMGLNLYPVASETELQFQTICEGEGT